ncbi:MAG TPA: glutamate 5-kinase [Caulobacteraceae bacterium]|nr:glutamate 5-kinase [Caulobacteraceae bacterium]
MSTLASARLVVVKVGSALIVDPQTGAADAVWLDALAADLGRLRDRGQKLLIVSSGAVALGRRRLALKRPSLTLPEKQAAAAAGQSRLMRAWEEALGPVGLTAAQVLMTPDDTEVRRRYLNVRATLETLLELGVTPVVNENDTVATEELRYGDNDRLAARVAQMVGADLLVLLSDVDGLYTTDPRRDPAARHIPLVEALTPEIEAMGGGANTEGSGGMATKLAAARIAAAAGCSTLITLGRRASPLRAVEEGAPATLFRAPGTPAAAYKAWIAGSLATQGSLVVDDGAARALRSGKSLLSAGVRAVEGRFEKGDAVLVRDLAGREVGRGLSRYDAADAARIVGLKSDAIEPALGYSAGPLIHADDLALAG